MAQQPGEEGIGLSLMQLGHSPTPYGGGFCFGARGWAPERIEWILLGSCLEVEALVT